MQAVMSATYQRGQFQLIPLGRTVLLAVGPDLPRPIPMPRRAGEMVASCRSFETVEQHTQRICRDLKLAQDEWPLVGKTLDEAIDRGLLVSSQRVLRAARARASEAGKHRLASVGVITKNQPDAVLRCLTSYGSHLKQHGRTLPMVVVDSSEPEKGGELRGRLRGLQRQLGVEILWIGIGEKLRMARELAAAAGLDPELVRFGLLDTQRHGHDVGTNRNALLLAHAGRTFLSTDDDMICELRQPQDADHRLVVSDEQPAQVVLHPDFASAQSSLVPSEACLADMHEQVLGRSVGSILSEWKDDEIRLGSLGASALGSWMGDARVVASFGGYYGDSGAGYPSFFLWSDPTIFRQLSGGFERYRAAIRSRQLVRMAGALTLSGSPFTMCGTVAFDARELLPPFFPVFRGEDLCFGHLLRTCSERSLFAYLPRAVGHLPWRQRVGSSELWNPSPFVSVVSMVAQIIDMAGAGAQLAGPGERRLRLFGRCIQEIASLPATDFEQLLRERVAVSVTRSAARLAQTLDDGSASLPEYGASDLRRYIEHHLNILANPDRGVPLELLGQGDARTASAAVQRLVDAYGKLVEAWPEILRVAQRIEPPRVPVSS
jgi:hypothetical protein